MSPLRSDAEFTHLASDEQIAKTIQSLEAHGMRTAVCATGAEARNHVLDLIPAGVEVFNSPSRTLEQIGLAADIEHPTRFQSARARGQTLDHTTQRREILKLMAIPDVLVGSVHAITEQGEILIASATGSQLASAAAGAGAVIWVVGTHKLVPTLKDGWRRIREHCLPLESERVKQAHGGSSAINKVLIVQGEDSPDRITVVLVKQQLGV